MNEVRTAVTQYENANDLSIYASGQSGFNGWQASSLSLNSASASRGSGNAGEMMKLREFFLMRVLLAVRRERELYLRKQVSAQIIAL